MRFPASIGFSCLLATALGCSGGDSEPDAMVVPSLPDAAPGSFPVSGTLMGAGTQAGDFNVLFTNTDNIGSLHVYGLGRSTDGSRFNLALPASIPAQAQIGGTVGVGHVVMVELDESLPERPSSSDGRTIIGVSTEHMIVYRAAPFVMQFPWEDNFDVNWGCGQCQRGVGGQPDTLTPIACTEVVVQMGAFGQLNACDPFSR